MFFDGLNPFPFPLVRVELIRASTGLARLAFARLDRAVDTRFDVLLLVGGERAQCVTFTVRVVDCPRVG